MTREEIISKLLDRKDISTIEIPIVAEALIALLEGKRPKRDVAPNRWPKGLAFWEYKAWKDKMEAEGYMGPFSPHICLAHKNGIPLSEAAKASYPDTTTLSVVS